MTDTNLQVRFGVVGGTLLSTAINISLHDVVFTIILAVIGAVVSFGVSSFLKWLFSSKRKN